LLACFCHKYPHTHMCLLSHFACALHGGGQSKAKNWKACLPWQQTTSLIPDAGLSQHWPHLGPLSPAIGWGWIPSKPQLQSLAERERERGRVSSYSQMLLNPVYRLCGVWWLATAIGDLWSLTYRLLLSGILGPDCNCGFSISYQSLDPNATAPSCPWTDRYTQHTASRWRIRSEVWLFH